MNSILLIVGGTALTAQAKEDAIAELKDYHEQSLANALDRNGDFTNFTNYAYEDSEKQLKSGTAYKIVFAEFAIKSYANAHQVVSDFATDKKNDWKADRGNVEKKFPEIEVLAVLDSYHTEVISAVYDAYSHFYVKESSTIKKHEDAVAKKTSTAEEALAAAKKETIDNGKDGYNFFLKQEEKVWKETEAELKKL